MNKSVRKEEEEEDGARARPPTDRDRRRRLHLGLADRLRRRSIIPPVLAAYISGTCVTTTKADAFVESDRGRGCQFNKCVLSRAKFYQKGFVILAS